MVKEDEEDSEERLIGNLKVVIFRWGSKLTLQNEKTKQKTKPIWIEFPLNINWCHQLQDALTETLKWECDATFAEDLFQFIDTYNKKLEYETLNKDFPCRTCGRVTPHTCVVSDVAFWAWECKICCSAWVSYWKENPLREEKLKHYTPLRWQRWLLHYRGLENALLGTLEHFANN